MSHTSSSRLGSLLLLLASLVSFGLALYAWLTPLTGVTGTLGALGVVIASVVLALLTLALRRTVRHGARLFCIIVTLFVLIGIGFAALLLHQGLITAAMVLGLVGLILLSRRATQSSRYVRD